MKKSKLFMILLGSVGCSIAIGSTAITAISCSSQFFQFYPQSTFSILNASNFGFVLPNTLVFNNSNNNQSSPSWSEDDFSIFGKDLKELSNNANKSIEESIIYTDEQNNKKYFLDTPKPINKFSDIVEYNSIHLSTLFNSIINTYANLFINPVFNMNYFSWENSNNSSVETNQFKAFKKHFGLNNSVANEFWAVKNQAFGEAKNTFSVGIDNISVQFNQDFTGLNNISNMPIEILKNEQFYYPKDPEKPFSEENLGELKPYNEVEFELNISIIFKWYKFNSYGNGGIKLENIDEVNKNLTPNNINILKTVNNSSNVQNFEYKINLAPLKMKLIQSPVKVNAWNKTTNKLEDKQYYVGLFALGTYKTNKIKDKRVEYLLFNNNTQTYFSPDQTYSILTNANKFSFNGSNWNKGINPNNLYNYLNYIIDNVDNIIDKNLNVSPTNIDKNYSFENSNTWIKYIKSIESNMK